MANLLTKQSKIKLVWDKRLRTIFIFVIMGLIGFVLAAATLLPVHIYTSVVLSGIKGTTDKASSDVTSSSTPSLGSQRQAIIRELKRDGDLLNQISKVASLPKVDELILNITNTTATIQGVELKLINLESNLGDNDNAYSLRLSGIAKSRLAVVSVRDAFEKNDQFSIVDFPLGNLTPQGDVYNFIISLKTNLIKDYE